MFSTDLGSVRPDQGRTALRLTFCDASEEDLAALVALNEPRLSNLAGNGRQQFHEQKLRSYLASANALVIVARMEDVIVGYVAGVINPAFVREMRRPSKLARQLWLLVSGGYGWHPARLWWLVRRAYARLWADPSCRMDAWGGRGPSDVGWLNQMIVAEEWRGRGIGGRLLDAAEAWLARRNVTTVGGDVLCDNAPSLRMLAKAGYQFVGEAESQGHTRLQIVVKSLKR